MVVTLENTFDVAVSAWLNRHMANATEQQLRRMKGGLTHASWEFLRLIWWPFRGHFDDLIPEMMIHEFKGGVYYVDFVYVRGGVRIFLEIQGFGPHWKDITDERFALEKRRDLYMIALGNVVLNIAYKDIVERSDMILSLIKMVLSRYEMLSDLTTLADIEERALLRFFVRQQGIARPVDVETSMQINHRTAKRLLNKACESGWLEAVGGPTGKRTATYRLVEHWWERWNHLLM